MPRMKRIDVYLKKELRGNWGRWMEKEIDSQQGSERGTAQDDMIFATCVGRVPFS